MCTNKPKIINPDLQKEIFNLFFILVPDMVKSINNDSIIKSYFDNFFGFFTKNFIMVNLSVIENTEQRDQYIKNYQKVENLNQMKSYFKSIPGLYSQLALWAIENPYKGKTPSEHHLILRSLREPFDFSKKQISVKYNLVQVHWIVHYLFHYIRLIEYGQIQDEKALYGLLQKRQTFKFSSSIILTKQQKTEIITNQNSLLTQLQKSYIQFEQERNQRYKEIGQIVGSQSLSPTAKAILSTNTIWYHEDDLNKNKSFFMFSPAQPKDRCSLLNLAEILIQAEHDRNNQLGISTPERNKKTIAVQLGIYFRGTDQRASIYGFYLANPPPGSPIVRKSLPGSEKFIQIQKNRYQNPDELSVLKNVSGYILKNEKYKISNNILQGIKSFNTFYEVATLCTEIEKEMLGKCLSKEPLKKYKNGLSEYLKKRWLKEAGWEKYKLLGPSRDGYLGWKLDRLVKKP